VAEGVGVAGSEADGLGSADGVPLAEGVGVGDEAAGVEVDGLGVRLGEGVGTLLTVAVGAGRRAPPIVVVDEPSSERPSPSSIAVITSIATTKVAATLIPIATRILRRRLPAGAGSAGTG
jgi:hypothetical protein